MTDNSSPEDLHTLYNTTSLTKRLKRAQKHVNLNDTEMQEIIDQYIKDTPIMFSNLNSAWTRSNYEEILLYAHSIVGVARLLKFNEIGEYAKIVEDAAKEQQHADKKNLKLLNKHHHASLKALRQLQKLKKQ